MSEQVIEASRPRAAESTVRRATVFISLTGALLLMVLLELAIGSVQIPATTVIAVLAGREIDTAGYAPIIWELRLPRVVTATMGGAGLAICGLQLQTLFRNPLAGPWALGITGGAQFGVALVVVAGASVSLSPLLHVEALANLPLVAGAGLGSLAALALILAASRRLSPVALLVLGLMVSFLSQALVSVLIHFTNETQAKIYGSWNEANYGAVGTDNLLLYMILIAVGLCSALWLSKPLNALLLGEEYARTLGVNVARTRTLLLVGVLITAGTITAHTGPLAFIDLAASHLARALLRTSDHKHCVPAVMLIGALIGAAADLLVNLPWEHHFLHVNAVNALIGAPVVIWVIMSRKRPVV